MNAGILRVDDGAYKRLAPTEQTALQDWVKSLFDCNPDHIEWIEFLVEPRAVNDLMTLSLIIVPQNPKRPTLLSETHVVPITTLYPKGLLKRLAEVGTWVTSSPPITQH